MGQGGSKVIVHVQLDAAYFYAGDLVTGTVALHTQQPIDVKAIDCKVRTLRIRHEGSQSPQASSIHVHQAQELLDDDKFEAAAVPAQKHTSTGSRWTRDQQADLETGMGGQLHPHPSKPVFEDLPCTPTHR
jgi:hypothetical protein